MSKLKKLFTENGISFIFLSVIVVLGSSGWLLQDQTTSASENRPLQQLPAFSSKALFDGMYTSQMETYLSDQFPLRSTWVKIHTNLEVQLGMKKINDVTIGKDGVLFQETIIPSKQFSKTKQEAINTFATKHSNVNISMLLVPNKATILKDKLPATSMHQDQKKIIQDFASGLDESITYVDTCSSFLKHKTEELYYRSDHHWTNRGAYLAFLEWKDTMMKEETLLEYQNYRVNDSFYGTLANTSGYFRMDADHIDISTSKDDPLYTVKYADSKQATTSLFDKSKINTNNPYEVFLKGNHPLVDIATTTENTRHLLLLKDSYANSFVSYLLPYYSKITIVDPRYYYEDLNQLIADREISDVLFLYNANTFFSDDALQNVIMEAK